eukprot:4596628-Prymnesium_polylepis.3
MKSEIKNTEANLSLSYFDALTLKEELIASAGALVQWINRRWVQQPPELHVHKVTELLTRHQENSERIAVSRARRLQTRPPSAPESLSCNGIAFCARSAPSSTGMMWTSPDR